MDKRYIDLHLVTDRYLSGTLSEEELSAFEERLVWDQELIEELGLAESLREAMRATVTSQGDNEKGGGGSFLAMLWSVPHYAAAASFLLAVGLTAATVLNLDPRSGIEAPTGPDIVPLFAVRSTGPATVELRLGAPATLLVEAAEGYSSYRLAIYEDESFEPIWIEDGIRPTYPESLAVSLPPGYLQPGRYRLSIEGELDSMAGEIVYEAVRDIAFEATIVE